MARRTGWLAMVVAAASLAGCFAASERGVKLEEVSAFILPGGSWASVTDITFDRNTRTLLAVDDVQVTEVTPSGNLVAVYGLEDAKSAMGIVGRFEAVGTGPDGEILLTSSDSNGWRLSRDTLTIEWYFCLGPGAFTDNDDPPVWTNGGVAVDDIGLTIFTAPSMARRGELIESTLEHYDLRYGVPLTETSLLEADLGATGLTWLDDRGTLLLAESDRLVELSPDGTVLTDAPAPVDTVSGVAYDAVTDTIFLLEDSGARLVTAYRVVHW